MDTASMTFQEILFNGRYHIIGGLLLLVFLGAFLREAVQEIMTAYAERRRVERRVAFGPVMHGSLGAVMTDGGEPVDESTGEDK
jgi:hypothetical protein